MKTIFTSLAISSLMLAAGRAWADEPTLESSPPVVVKTVPESGAKNVDPKLKEIKVTFSKPMTDRSWSPTSISKETFPEVAGQLKYLADKRTFVLPVKLAAGKTYAILLNSEKFQNFKDAQGHSAMPYLLVFKTKGEPAGGAADTGSAASQPWSDEIAGRALDGLWDEMDRHYSYFFFKQDVDWKTLKEQYRPLAVKAKNSQELAEVLQPMLAQLRDMHVWIESAEGRLQPYGSGYTYNGNHAATGRILQDTTPCGDFAVVGKTKPEGFGYFLMLKQSKASEDNVRQAIEAIAKLRDAPGFIVDLRQANGGSEPLAQRIAQLFCAKDTVYARSKFRSGRGHEEFTEQFPRTLTASAGAYTRPVVCLFGPGAVSSGEGFVKMMKCLPQVTTVGMPTRDASGNPEPFEMQGTGLTVWFSRWVDSLPSGETFEGRGIPPDVRVDEPPAAYTQRDPTLAKGLEILRDKIASAKLANQ